MPNDVDAELVLQQVQRILRGATFRKPSRLRNLLRLLVEAALHGRSVKQDEIGSEILKDRAFDPDIDPRARSAVRDLRGKLREYYSSEGSGDLIRIQIETGDAEAGYVAVFKTVTDPNRQHDGGNDSPRTISDRIDSAEKNRESFNATSERLSPEHEHELRTLLDIWWPENGARLSGRQPFKALVRNKPLHKYEMNWHVPGDPRAHRMQNAFDRENPYADHKEALVHLADFFKPGDNTIIFVAQESTGHEIARNSVNFHYVARPWDFTS